MFDVLEIQLERGKEKASKVFHNKDLSFDEQILALRFFLSRHYNIPLFSKYLTNRTVEEIIFEVELIKLSRTPTAQNTSALMNENKKEIESMFDDFVEQDAEPFEITDKDKQIFGEFMKTGEFVK